MLKSVFRHLDDLLIGQGPYGVLDILFDRVKFYLFFQFYYPRKFKNYGKNIRWGRDFRKLTISKSIRISSPEKISIADDCKFDEFVYLQCDSHKDSGISIGRKTRVNAFTHILSGSSIVIAEEVLIAPFCLIASNNHRFDLEDSIMNQGMKHSGNIHIGKGSWIGQNAKILGGSTLGERVVVGAGALVKRGEYKAQSKILNHSSDLNT